MPHQRTRLLLASLERRLAHFPIVGVLGARQTGKSTLLRELLAKKRRLNYVTLDREENRALAEKQPSLFIEGLEAPEFDTVCIDEIQKVPLLFDTIKAEVDEQRRPGRFAISGSTEFSKKTGVRESLTGRIALLRLFPLTCRETASLPQRTSARFPLTELPQKTPTHAPLEKSLTLKHVQTWFERGGMPGIFAVRDEANRESMYENWLETTCTRDLAQFGIPKFNPELARRIFLSVARIETPNRAEVARAVGKTPPQIERYLEGFQSLFALYSIEPFRTGVGKAWFYPFDAGIARFAGASSEKCARIWLLNECFAQFSYAGKMRPDIFRYETSRGSIIDFVLETKEGPFALKWTDQEAPGTYLLRSVAAFQKKHPEIPVVIIAPCKAVHRVHPKAWIVPWNAIP
jgi:predicted AAA+ superfamily ATPase